MESKPNILLFTDWYLPAYKAGGPVVSIYQLVQLMQKKFQFYIICSNSDLGENEAFKNIDTNTWIDGDYGEKIKYWRKKNCIKNNYLLLIKETKPMAIYYNSVFSYNFTLKPIFYYLKLYDVKQFLSPRGMLHSAAISLKSRKKRLFLWLIKYTHFFRNIIFIATDKQEQKYISHHELKTPIIIVPNIPDCSFLDLETSIIKQNHIITIARIAPEKNALMALDVISEISKPITYTWIGDSKNKNYFDSFMQKAQNLPPHIDFKYLGALPKKEVKKVILESNIFFLPTLGENYGHAIFEALAASLPSVIGNNTPFINADMPGLYQAASDNKNQFRIHLENLLSLTKDEYIEEKKAAKKIAENSFDEKKLFAQYLEIFWDK